MQCVIVRYGQQMQGNECQAAILSVCVCVQVLQGRIVNVKQLSYVCFASTCICFYKFKTNIRLQCVYLYVAGVRVAEVSTMLRMR